MEFISIYIEYIAKGIEITGILVIITGTILALSKFAFALQNNKVRSFKIMRQDLGNAILLGLEILVTADIISTMVTKPTMEQVLTLGVIVLIRTFLSLSIQVEVEGKFPWQKEKTQ